MIYRVSDIARQVRVAIDENHQADALVLGNDMDTLSLDNLIRSKVVEAVRRVHQSAPVEMLESGHQLEDDVYWDGDGRGHVLLPDDFMRLVSFRMSDWERSVHEVIPIDSAEYAMQSSRHKGIRGNWQKPVCAIAPSPAGRVLEFYSCRNEDAHVKVGQYIPYPVIDRDGGVDISELCKEAVVYATAALVLKTYGEADMASVMTELSDSLLQ